MFTSYSLKSIGNVLLLPGFIAVVVFGSASQGEGPAEFPLTKRTFRLGLSFHPAHKKGEASRDLQRALGEALTLAGRNAELFGHWVVKPWYEHSHEQYSLSLVEKRRAHFDFLANHHDLRPILNFNFWDISREPGGSLNPSFQAGILLEGMRRYYEISGD